MEGQLHIDSMWAFVATDKDGTEGIPAFQSGAMLLPLVGADMQRIESMRPIAQTLADERGITIKLVHFTNRQEIETITPATTKKP
jgi:hypothetical protein